MPGAIARKARISKKKQARPQAQISVLSNFGRVSKVRSSEQKILVEVFDGNSTAGVTCPTTAEPSRKRRAASPIPESGNETATAKPDAVRRAAAIPNKRQRRTAESTVKSNTAPGEQAHLLLQKLALQSPRSRLGPHKVEGRETRTVVFPQALQDLVALQAAFLKTVTLQLSHNGPNVPIDLRELCPSIAQAWGKRKVTVDDICICLGVPEPTKALESRIGNTDSPFRLCDYGRGKMCVELVSDISLNAIDESRLRTNFDSALRHIWGSQQSSGHQDVNCFVAKLPRAPIEVNRSGSAATGSLAKARRTFEELTNGVVKKQEKEDKLQGTPALNTDGTKTSLLDRIRAKQMLQSQAAKPPTTEELQRRSALHRAEDVAAVIAMLVTSTAAGQGRVAFTMAMIQQKLRDSLRVPIGQEEGIICVRLLATEIAPQWMRVVTVGGRENVVIQPAFQPIKGAIGDCVAKMLLL